tara:strand:- start:236 stop:610 length:375 start_codon:yes stop_codon:yes gene_type:complete
MEVFPEVKLILVPHVVPIQLQQQVVEVVENQVQLRLILRAMRPLEVQVEALHGFLQVTLLQLPQDLMVIVLRPVQLMEPLKEIMVVADGINILQVPQTLVMEAVVVLVVQVVMGRIQEYLKWVV